MLAKIRLHRPLVYLSIKSVPLFSDKHNYTDLVYLAYLTLLYISAVQISHYQVGHGHTKRVKGTDLSLLTLGTKLL